MQSCKCEQPADTCFNSPRREVGVGAAEGLNPHLAMGAIGLGVSPRRRSAGFSLIEILLSLGIFAIGMTAIVSLFPAAAILQRETTQEVISEMAAQSAASIIDAQALTYNPPGTTPRGDLGNYHANAASTNSQAVPFYDMDATLITQRYSPADRSYPTGVIDRSVGTMAEAIADCDMHWVPFIQDINGDPANPNWIVRLFILEADSRATYTMNNAADANRTDPVTFPKVRSVGATATGDTFTAAGTDLEPGDTVMDNNGNSHVVVDVNGNIIEVLNTIPQVPNAINTLWYAPQLGGSRSPGMRVVTVEVDVVAP